MSYCASSFLSSFVPVSRNRSVYIILCAAMAFLIGGCGGPAALESPEAFSSADALYTAITAHRVDLVQDVDTRLHKLHESGKVSDAAWNELSDIIRTARDNRWQEAAEVLDAFIRRQPEHSHAH
jgi:hypothetical protein